MEHEKYIQRCLDLAEKALGNTYPNPVVGCVIVHNGKIIGEGYHEKAGKPHAEINAINSVENPELLPESDIYVSLEPCAHYGKTPPCALKLKEIGFKKVIIGTLDYHDKVNGKGKEILENAGIQTFTGVLEKECREINKRFFTFHQKKRPYIVLKWAQSADGFLDRNFHPYPISNKLASQYVHQIRAAENAILVGTQTAINDNPTLDVRHFSGKNPVRILIDFDLKVPPNSNIFNDVAPTLIFNSKKNVEEGYLKFIKIGRENFLADLMEKLYENQIQSVLVEGGSFTLQQFLNAGLWDEMVIIKNEKLFLEAGTKAPKINQEPFEKINLRENTVELYRNV